MTTFPCASRNGSLRLLRAHQIQTLLFTDEDLSLIHI